MVKFNKIKSVREAHKAPLHEQLLSGRTAKKKNREPKFHLRQEEEKEINPTLSKQILNQVRKQQQELTKENDGEPIRPTTSLGADPDSDDDDDAIEESGLDSEYHNPEINEEDEEALKKFMSKNPAPRITLADIILEKINEKQTEIQTQFSDAGTVMLEEINPQVKELYVGVKEVLSKYRSGKLPKAFKLIPKMKNWEQLLYLTDPMGWSAATMYQGTRIFASNLKENMAQRFYNLVLLPRIRDDISEYKRLNFHLYQALRKALFKPGAFMKGIIIPLCEGGCTLREAVIIGSVVARYSIPMLHSAAMINVLTEMEYNGSNHIFLRILLEKKYALPYKVVDGVVFHFLRFERDTRELPVLWHQALLSFVQIYKNNISSEQKEALQNLLRSKSHHMITPLIRRELDNSQCRDLQLSEIDEQSVMDVE